MNKKLLTLFILAFTALQVEAQKKPLPLLEVNGEIVSVDEFEYLYSKNFDPKKDKRDEKSLREYMELFVKFKLKVSAAKEQKIDRSPDFEKEFAGYKAQITRPYMTEKQVTERLLKESYERMQQEVRASHILIFASAKASPSDTALAFKLINEVYEKAKNGEDFNQLAKLYSQDESAQENGGDLGYFTAFQMVYDFENVAFQTPVGQISKPFRTDFGYHILKVQDKRPSRGTAYVAHLMILAREGMNAEDSLAAYRNILEIKAKLDAGEDWNKLVKQYSDDANTRDKGGELQALSAGVFPPQLSNFVETAFALQNPNQISEPVKTPYGWHLIKLQKKSPVPAYQAIENELKLKIQKDSRSQLPQKAFLDRIKKENQYLVNAKNYQLAMEYFDSSLVAGKWSYDSTAPAFKKPIFSIEKKTYSIGEFFSYAKKNQAPSEGYNPKAYAAELFKKFEEKANLEYQEANLARKYPEYKNLEREYHEGLMLFRIMEQEVWNKAGQDSSGLEKFFAENNQKYRWKERVDILAATAKSKELLDSIVADFALPRYAIQGEEISFNVSANKTELPQAFRTLLDRTASKMRRNDYTTLDLISQKAENEADTLEDKRIDEVIAYLTAYKIDRSKIKIVKQPTPIPNQPRFVLALFANGKKHLESVYNSRNPLKVKVFEGKYELGENPIADLHFGQIGEFRGENGGEFYYIKVKERLQPQPKALSEVRGQVIADYQIYLEEKWLKSLRARFPVKINENNFKKLFAKK
jgi:peptidyl-prolyl cis-trans isomerase SurA